MDKVTLSMFQFMESFPNEQAAITWFESKRWSNTVTCPSCQSNSVGNLQLKNFYQCHPCKLKFSVRTNTIMHRSHIPLHKWLYAMYCVVTARKGISSLQLSKELGIRQASAWFLLQRIRLACKSDDQLLGHVVEIDKTYIGGKEAHTHTSKKLNASRGPVGQ